MNDSTLAIEFPVVAGRKVTCAFDGGQITSDAGLLVVGKADRLCGLSAVMAQSVSDRRQSSKVTHEMVDLIRERVYAIAMGYEDANDLDSLRSDAALNVACLKPASSAGALASQPTISRFENSVARSGLLRMGLEMARVVVSQLPADTRKVMLDIDATDDPCHGQQELSLFDGHYGRYCYLPLYMHITDQTGRQRLLGTLLRSACGRSNKGVMSFVRLAVRAVRQRFAEAEITIRGDCGFGYGELMNWCDANGIGYVFAFQSNKSTDRLVAPLEEDLSANRHLHEDGYREYGEYAYQAKTWLTSRRLIVKAEVCPSGIDMRLVVTSDVKRTPGEAYVWYTQRGDRENRIKEMKLDLCSGRTSCHRFLANQLRLLLHSAACILMGVLQHALEGTRWARAQVGTLRLRLLKVGARVVQSCRKIWFHLASSFPDQDIWCLLYGKLCCDAES